MTDGSVTERGRNVERLLWRNANWKFCFFARAQISIVIGKTVGMHLEIIDWELLLSDVIYAKFKFAVFIKIFYQGVEFFTSFR